MAFNRHQQRKVALDKRKTDEAKRKRLQLKVKRTKESQIRKPWSKKHGHDTYGEEDEDIEHDPNLTNRGESDQNLLKGNVQYVCVPLTGDPTSETALLTKEEKLRFLL